MTGQFYEEFFEYSPDRIDSTYFGSTKIKELINVKSRMILGGRVQEIISVGKYGNRREVFNYDGDRLQSIDVEEFERAPGNAAGNYQTVLEYEKSGKVIAIRNIFPNGRIAKVYPPE